MAGTLQDRGAFKGIARALLALALLAERAAGRSFPARFLVLLIIYRAEAIARRFVARETATLVAEALDAGCPDIPFPDLACLDEPAGLHYGAADAGLLSLRLRVLAAVLDVLAVVDDRLDGGCGDHAGDCLDRWVADGSAGWAAGLASCAAGGPLPPLLVILRLPAARRASRPP